MDTFVASWRSATTLERWAFAVVAVASFVSLAFSLAGYPTMGHDADVHLNWLEQFSRLAHQGLWYPRWLSDSNAGFGSPTFYFYPPLPYWVASVVRWFVWFIPSPFYNLIALLPTLGSLLTARFLLRQHSPNQLAVWTGALLYSFLAYRFADVFVRDALTEHWALMFLPLLFLRIENPYRAIAILAIGWAGLFLTNIPIAILAVASVIVKYGVERDVRGLRHHALAAALAACIASCYLLPATFMRGFIHEEHLRDIVFRSTGFALLDLFANHGWLRFLAAATLIAGGIYVAMQRPGKSNGWWWLTLLCVVLQIPIFWPLWHVHLASLIQFSWRLDGVLLLALAVAIAVERTRLVSILAVSLALVTLVGESRLASNFVIQPPLPFDQFRMDAPEYTPAWTPENPGIVRTLTWQHYYDAPAQLLGLTNAGDSIGLLSKVADSKTFRVHLTRATPARFHLFYWPYWKAHTDTQSVTLKPDAYGFAEAQLAPGDYYLRLELIHSREEIVGGYVSIVGAIVLVALLGVARTRKTSDSV